MPLSERFVAAGHGERDGSVVILENTHLLVGAERALPLLALHEDIALLMQQPQVDAEGLHGSVDEG